MLCFRFFHFPIKNYLIFTSFQFSTFEFTVLERFNSMFVLVNIITSAIVWLLPSFTSDITNFEFVESCHSQFQESQKSSAGFAGESYSTQLFNSPLGLNIKEYIIYRKKFWKIKWVYFSFIAHAKVFFPSLYNKIKNSV